MNLNVPLSGMRAAELRQQAAANNIANAATPGYRAVRVESTEAADGGVRAGATRAGNASEEAPVELASEIADTLVNTAMYKANAAMVRAQDELLGALLDTRR